MLVLPNRHLSGLVWFMLTGYPHSSAGVQSKNDCAGTDEKLRSLTIRSRSQKSEERPDEMEGDHLKPDYSFASNTANPNVHCMDS
jgi:hypothetical protein